MILTKIAKSAKSETHVDPTKKSRIELRIESFERIQTIKTRLKNEKLHQGIFYRKSSLIPTSKTCGFN